MSKWIRIIHNPTVTDSVEDGYSGEVEVLFSRLTSYKNNVATAKLKMNKFPHKGWDERYAIAIINLYTQASSFYSKLNAQMRNGYPDKTTDIWEKAGDLINRGLDILRPTVHEAVYRGCGQLDVLPVAGKDYSFRQITSTSKSKTVALNFLCSDGFLFTIKNVYGVSVQDYSYFGNEKEVILKSTNIFKVKSGPQKEGKYNVFFLDGQANVNGVGKTDTGDLSKYTFTVAFIWFIYELILM